MKFYEEPTHEMIVEALTKVPRRPGLVLEDWAGSVTIITSSEKVQGAQKEYRNVWAVYFDVATRVLMALKWHEEQGEGKIGGEPYLLATVDFPDDVSPDADRFFVVRVVLESPYLKQAIGYATADISESGARADRTNPVENAITSAYGRALGLCWGFGLLPGSGAIASADEIAIALERRGAAVKPGRRSKKKTSPKDAPPPNEEAPENVDDFAEEEGDDASQIVEQARVKALEKLRATAVGAFGEDGAEAKLLSAYAKLKRTKSEDAPAPEEWGMEDIARLSKKLKESIGEEGAKK